MVGSASDLMAGGVAAALTGSVRTVLIHYLLGLGDTVPEAVMVMTAASIGCNSLLYSLFIVFSPC